MPLDNIKIILCDTTHTGNIGACARAMKNMGLKNLILVSPRVTPDDHSLALASNARDIIDTAIICDNLDTALYDVHFAVALTARRREFSAHLQTPDELLDEIMPSVDSDLNIAFVFGAERTGLTIEQIEKCNKLVTIPGNPKYLSLNLAQAVQIICYEIYKKYLQLLDNDNKNDALAYLKNHDEKPSTIADNQNILSHLYEMLDKTNYNFKNEEITKRKLQQIINKAQLNREEVGLIHGILRNILLYTSLP